MVRLINGATKGGIHFDRRKEENKNFCRERGDDRDADSEHDWLSAEGGGRDMGTRDEVASGSAAGTTDPA